MIRPQWPRNRESLVQLSSDRPSLGTFQVSIGKLAIQRHGQTGNLFATIGSFSQRFDYETIFQFPFHFSRSWNGELGSFIIWTRRLYMFDNIPKFWRVWENKKCLRLSWKIRIEERIGRIKLLHTIFTESCWAVVVYQISDNLDTNRIPNCC